MNPDAMTVESLRLRERRAMRLWTCAIVGLLLFGILLSVGGAIAAVRHRPAIEESYYEKALHWDDQAALAQASIALEWKTELTLGEDVTTAGERALMLRLTDKSGASLEDASVSIAFFHRAKPLELRQMELRHVGGGLYAASAAVTRAGIWEFRLTIRRAGAGADKPDLFVQSITRDVIK